MSLQPSCVSSVQCSLPVWHLYFQELGSLTEHFSLLSFRAQQSTQSEARDVIFCKCTKNYSNTLYVYEHAHTIVCFFPCSLERNSPHFTFNDSRLLTSPGYLFRNQLLEKCVLILSSRTLLLWPLIWGSPSLPSSLHQPIFVLLGLLFPLWRRPSCFNLVSISVEAVPH